MTSQKHLGKTTVIVMAVMSFLSFIYPDATEEEFKEKLDLMMKSRPTIEINGMRSNVGFSTGYVHDILDEPQKLRSLFAAADERMYQMKRSHGLSERE